MLRSQVKLIASILLTGCAVAIAYPVLGEKKPQSLLPPGFAQAPPPKDVPQKPEKPAAPEQPASDLLDDLKLNTPEPPKSDTAQHAQADPSVRSSGADALSNAVAAVDDTSAEPPQPYDLPPEARRSLAKIGLIGPSAGGLSAQAFGHLDGKALEHTMRQIAAPIASRWASILLRRTLVSELQTPQHVNGADWTAERAWLLLRMGEADAARMLIQRVDIDNYTPKLYAVAMQSALANGDLASFCPLVPQASKLSDEPAWAYGRAICASLSGESGSASALLREADQDTDIHGIDARLAERVVGAGKNTRRAVIIEWNDVSSLNAWRFGTATAVGLTIPAPLYDTVRPNVRAWAARAPMLKLSDRVDAVDWAAALGVYSNTAMVDFYSALADQSEQTRNDTSPQGLLQSAYVGEGTLARMTALQALWTQPNLDPLHQYARYILTARAAARVPVEAAQSKSIDAVTAAMMSSGLDLQAARWSRIANDGDDDAAKRAWGLLAVGAPSVSVDISERRLSVYRSTGALRSRFLVAALAALGRIQPADAARITGDFSVAIGQKTIWSRAIDAAADRGEAGSVALLAAAGLQSTQWSNIPAEHLFHIVRALKAVGHEPEARMIAAEALTRA
jgi:hypothetical protein